MHADTAFTVTGTVAATPAYPGPQRIDSPRPSVRPVSGATVTLAAAGTTGAATTTDADGHFSFTVPPGQYDITATNTGGYRSHATQHITVTGPTTVELVVDSGMR